MDWQVLLAGGAFALTLVGTTSGFVYLIMRLITNPMKDDIDEMKDAILKMGDKMKSEEDLKNMIQAEIAKHERNCPNKKGR